jgi:hypothetical protein
MGRCAKVEENAAAARAGDKQDAESAHRTCGDVINGGRVCT